MLGDGRQENECVTSLSRMMKVHSDRQTNKILVPVKAYKRPLKFNEKWHHDKCRVNYHFYPPATEIGTQCYCKRFKFRISVFMARNTFFIESSERQIPVPIVKKHQELKLKKQNPSNWFKRHKCPNCGRAIYGLGAYIAHNKKCVVVYASYGS